MAAKSLENPQLKIWTYCGPARTSWHLFLNLGAYEKASAHLVAWADWLEPGRDRGIYSRLSLASSGDLVGPDQAFQRACDLLVRNSRTIDIDRLQGICFAYRKCFTLWPPTKIQYCNSRRYAGLFVSQHRRIWYFYCWMVSISSGSGCSYYEI